MYNANKDLSDLLIKGYITAEASINNVTLVFRSIPESYYNTLLDNYPSVKFAYLAHSLLSISTYYKSFDKVDKEDIIDMLYNMPNYITDVLYSRIFMNFTYRVGEVIKIIEAPYYEDSPRLLEINLCGDKLRVPLFSSMITGCDYTERYGLNTIQTMWTWKQRITDIKAQNKSMFENVKILVAATNSELYKQLNEMEKNKENSKKVDYNYYRSLAEMFGQEKALKVMEKTTPGCTEELLEMDDANNDVRSKEIEYLIKEGFSPEEASKMSYHEYVVNKYAPKEEKKEAGNVTSIEMKEEIVGVDYLVSKNTDSDSVVPCRKILKTRRKVK